MAKRIKTIHEKTAGIGFRESLQAFVFIPRLLQEIWQTSRYLFVIHVGSRIIQAVLPISMLWVGKIIIDEIIRLTQSDQVDPSTLWKWIILELILALASDMLNRLVNLTDGLIGDKYAFVSSAKIIRKTSELSMAQLEDPDFYDKLERARRQTTNRVGLITNILAQIQSIISVLSLIVGLIYFEPWLVVLLIVSIIPSFINELKFGFVGYSLARSWTAERRELDYLRYIGANYRTAQEIKLFGLTRFITDKFEKLSLEYYALNKAIAIKKTLWGILLNTFGALAYYGAYVMIIASVLQKLISVGELTFLTGSFAKLRQNLQQIFSRFTRISQSALYLSDYFEYLDIPIPQKSSTNPIPLPDKMKTGFAFEHVHFQYPGSEQVIINDLSFTLQPGEKLALVGQNGAGKTTLIKLLLRFYEPTSGRITLDGKDIAEYDLKAYRQFFGVIFQDFYKYEFTLRENIAIGDITHINDETVIHSAAQRSLADEVARQLPQQYDQQLGKRFNKGMDLSGGQWQKVALARAYMKDAQVMILDEPTSALDAKAEYEVFERFMQLTEDKTSIIISHRFSTVRMASTILVLQNGRLLEKGSHEELMANNQLYAELFALQAAGYQ